MRIQLASKQYQHKKSGRLRSPLFSMSMCCLLPCDLQEEIDTQGLLVNNDLVLLRACQHRKPDQLSFTPMDKYPFPKDLHVSPAAIIFRKIPNNDLSSW